MLSQQLIEQFQATSNCQASNHGQQEYHSCEQRNHLADEADNISKYTAQQQQSSEHVWDVQLASLGASQPTAATIPHITAQKRADYAEDAENDS